MGCCVSISIFVSFLFVGHLASCIMQLHLVHLVQVKTGVLVLIVGAVKGGHGTSRSQRAVTDGGATAKKSGRAEKHTPKQQTTACIVTSWIGAFVPFVSYCRATKHDSIHTTIPQDKIYLYVYWMYVCMYIYVRVYVCIYAGLWMETFSLQALSLQ